VSKQILTLYYYIFADAFNSVLKKCSHISVIVNNAGIADEHNIQRCININLVSVSIL